MSLPRTPFSIESQQLPPICFPPNTHTQHIRIFPVYLSDREATGMVTGTVTRKVLAHTVIFLSPLLGWPKRHTGCECPERRSPGRQRPTACAPLGGSPWLWHRSGAAWHPSELPGRALKLPGSPERREEMDALFLPWQCVGTPVPQVKIQCLKPSFFKQRRFHWYSTWTKRLNHDLRTGPNLKHAFGQSKPPLGDLS